jgi:hypothetical protein
MFMRYLGGGVGHCPASIPVYDECDDDEDMDTDEAPLAELGDNHGTTGDIPLEDNEDEVWESDEDEDEDEDEDGSDTDRPYRSDGEEDEDLGPEDGEDDDDEEADLDEYDDL